MSIMAEFKICEWLQERSKNFDDFIAMQKESADRHAAYVLEHDGYISSRPSDKLFACLKWSDRYEVISIPHSELSRYCVVGWVDGCIMPIVALRVNDEQRQ